MTHQPLVNQPRWKILHLELSQAIPELRAEPAYQGILVVLWWHRIPLGNLEISAQQLPMPATQLAHLALQQITPAVGSHLLDQGFQAPLPGAFGWWLQADDLVPKFSALMALQPLSELRQRLSASPHQQTISVIVCTRNRPEQLARCLRSLRQLSRPPHEILVVDNAPSSDATYQLVAQIPEVRYIQEPRPGLSIARNTGICHSTGDLVAFTDDDVEVHPDWLEHSQRGFSDPQVMVVTGLIIPAELETEAQQIFQQGSTGFGWGYRPLIFGASFFEEMKPYGVPVWRIGAGANMAFRRQAFEQVGNFDQRLGAGASGCSEDSEMWYRILAEGWRCRYEPTAVVYHYHRATLTQLKQQMYAYMRGHVTALLIQAMRYQHWGNLRRLLIALPRYYTGLLIRGLFHGFKGRYSTVIAEVLGCLSGIGFYFQNRVASPNASSSSSSQSNSRSVLAQTQSKKVSV